MHCWYKSGDRVTGHNLLLLEGPIRCSMPCDLEVLTEITMHVDRLYCMCIRKQLFISETVQSLTYFGSDVAPLSLEYILFLLLLGYCFTFIVYVLSRV